MMADSSYEISGKLYHVRFYGKSRDNYSSSFQMLVDGKTGVLYGLNGIDFFRAIKLHIRDVMRDLGVDVVLFTMRRSAYLALSRSLRGIATMDIVRGIEAYGRDMLEIRLELVNDSKDSYTQS